MKRVILACIATLTLLTATQSAKADWVFIITGNGWVGWQWDPGSDDGTNWNGGVLVGPVLPLPWEMNPPRPGWPTTPPPSDFGFLGIDEKGRIVALVDHLSFYLTNP